MARIITGLLLAALGGFITVKAQLVYSALGPIPWAERHLGTEGGSRFMYALIGITVSIVGFLIMTDLMRAVILWIFGPLFGGFQRPTI